MNAKLFSFPIPPRREEPFDTLCHRIEMFIAQQVGSYAFKHLGHIRRLKTTDEKTDALLREDLRVLDVLKKRTRRVLQRRRQRRHS